FLVSVQTFLDERNLLNKSSLLFMKNILGKIRP
ncbi:MAG: hypothetical protein ACI888_001255, partial [Flavobacteriales bacterium]